MAPLLPQATLADIVSAPGPQGADGLPGHRRCRSPCQRAFQHSGNRKINILFLRHASQPATQDRTCEATSISAFGVRIPCLTKVEGPFQSTQGSGGRPRLTCCQHAHGVCVWGGGGPCSFYSSKTGGTEGGSSEGMVGTGFCTATWSWVLRGPCQGTGSQDYRVGGSRSSRSQFQKKRILSAKVSKSEQTVNQSTTYTLQTGSLRSRPRMRPAPSGTASCCATRPLTSGLCSGERLILR